MAVAARAEAATFLLFATVAVNFASAPPVLRALLTDLDCTGHDTGPDGCGGTCAIECQNGAPCVGESPFQCPILVTETTGEVF